MESKLEKACKGKTAANGGMDINEIKENAKTKEGYDSNSLRKDLLKLICIPTKSSVSAIVHDILVGVNIDEITPKMVRQSAMEKIGQELYSKVNADDFKRWVNEGIDTYLKPKLPKPKVPKSPKSPKSPSSTSKSPKSPSAPASTEEIEKTCKGKTAAKGGLNIDQIRSEVKRKVPSHNGLGRKKDLLELLCDKKQTTVPKPVSTTTSSSSTPIKQPSSPSKPASTEEIEKTCKGKTAANGGLNIDQIRSEVKRKFPDHNGLGRKKDLLELLCDKKQTASVPKPTSTSPSTLTAPSTAPLTSPSTATLTAPSTAPLTNEADKLEKTCKNKTAANGGMTMDEIRAYAQKNHGHSGLGLKKELLEVICGPKVAMAPKPKTSAEVPAAMTMTYPKPPEMTRGQVIKNTKAWLTRKPINKEERTDILTKCGDKCFLSNNQMNPICSINNCKTDCTGLRAAYNLAHIKTNSTRIKPQAIKKLNMIIAKSRNIGKNECKWTI